MRRHLALAAMLILALAPASASAGHGCWGGWGGVSYGGFYGPAFGYGYYGGYWPRRAFYGSYYDPYGIYYSPYTGYSSYYLPPVFAPAELLYGPRAVQQFWGIQPQPLIVRRGEGADEEPRVRVTNAEYRRRADQFVAQGDRLFAEQKYSQALDRYKQAAAMVPDLAEAQWRKGHAYVAVSRYELAAASFKRALALDPEVDRGDFNLARLYGPARIALASHLESLAGETLVRSDSADHYFLLGIFLRYSGERERAEKFFLRAQELAGEGAAHVAGFLPPADAVPVAARELET